jgi:ketosteroid isomerase-like protein
VDGDANLALARRYIDATGACDLETLVELMAPDSVVWHNHDDREVDAATTARSLGWLHRSVPDLAWETTGLFATTKGFVWQAVLTGDAPQGPLRLHSCVVATVSGAGRIVRVEEYLDSAGLSVLQR